MLGSALLLLLCMIAYPFGNDQSVFAVGGELIFHRGALLYRDFLELKPPLIFYLYGFALWIFGHHEWSIRLLDVIYHVICFFFLYRFLYEIFKSHLISSLSILTYTILYISGGYWETSQTESFSLLPSLAILKILLNFEKKTLQNIKNILLDTCFVAIITIVLFLLKFTLIIIPAASLFYLFFFSDSPFRKRI